MYRQRPPARGDPRQQVNWLHPCWSGSACRLQGLAYWQGFGAESVAAPWCLARVRPWTIHTKPALRQIPFSSATFPMGPTLNIDTLGPSRGSKCRIYEPQGRRWRRCSAGRGRAAVSQAPPHGVDLRQVRYLDQTTIIGAVIVGTCRATVRAQWPDPWRAGGCWAWPSATSGKPCP